MVCWPVASESNFRKQPASCVVVRHSTALGVEGISDGREACGYCDRGSVVSSLSIYLIAGNIFQCFSLFINLKSAHVSGRQPAPELACIATGPTCSCFGIATFAIHDFAANECCFNCNYWQCVLTNHKAFARSSTEAHPTTTQKSAFSVLLYCYILSKFCVDKMFLKVHLLHLLVVGRPRYMISIEMPWEAAGEEWPKKQGALWLY